MKRLCIYHSNCADGFASAVVVRQALGKDNVDFHPGIHGQSPPDVKGRDVIIVDFSYKRPVLLAMAEQANTIIILDHHKSAEEDLVDLPDNVLVRFDMEHSGAVITYKYYFRGKPIPLFLEYIEDRDLWRFKLPDSRDIMACIFSYPYDFNLWGGFVHSNLAGFAEKGKAINQKHFKDINEFIKVGKYRMSIAGHDVPVLNVPYQWGSDACHIMCENEPFAAYYWDGPNDRNYGLRSREGGADVSAIAKQYGGGGHKHAAGFCVPMKPFDITNKVRLFAVTPEVITD